MLRKMKVIRRNIELIFADSSDHNTTMSDWLPGRIMNRLWGNWVIVFDKDTIKIDHLGRWMAFQISNNNKRVLIITYYRILVTSKYGIYYSIIQYNKVKGNAKSIAKHRT